MPAWNITKPREFWCAHTPLKTLINMPKRDLTSATKSIARPTTVEAPETQIFTALQALPKGRFWSTGIRCWPWHPSFELWGQTSAAGIYWQSDLPYLQSVQDPFCQNHRNASWQKQVSKSEWHSFLQSKGITNPAEYGNYTFTNRQKYFNRNPDITMRQIRDQFKLRSTYFLYKLPEKPSLLMEGDLAMALVCARSEPWKWHR